MAATRGFGHIHLFVRDLERSVDFYCQAFGMRLAFREPPRLAFLNTPGTEDLVTLQQLGPGRPPQVEGSGVWHFGFLVAAADLEDLLLQAVASGGRVAARGEHGPGVPYAVVVDPDGYHIELCDWRAELPAGG